MNHHDIYSAPFVRTLFDEMARTYGITNLISSFGFCRHWRHQCVAQVMLQPGMTVCDFMTGMGECWSPIVSALQGQGSLFAVDFAPQMCRRAQANRRHLPMLPITVLEADALTSALAAGSIDCVIATFGLKTLNDEQKGRFAHEIARVLKPNGVFSLLEISVPRQRLLRLPYMFYLKQIIPLIGKLLLGNPDNYRMLGIYTEQFQSCERMRYALLAAGLQVSVKSFFFGCATGVYGYKLSSSATATLPNKVRSQNCEHPDEAR